jgi:hypothetical protein
MLLKRMARGDVHEMRRILREDIGMSAETAEEEAAMKQAMEFTAAPRHQKWRLETEGRKGNSVAQFRTRRPAIFARCRDTAPVWATFTFETWRPDWLAESGELEPSRGGIKN